MNATAMLSLVGAVLLFTAGSVSAAQTNPTHMSAVSRQVLEHNCADAKARYSAGDPEITTQCGESDQ